MSEQKLLSIILPTHNGSTVLPFTLSQFREQVERNSELVDFCVCNNASTDNTLSILKGILQDSKFFRIVDYKEFAPSGGKSIARAIENATGKYVLLWGDDDIPSPMFIDYILLLLRKYDGIGGICLNKCRGYSNHIGLLQDVFWDTSHYSSGEILYDDSVDFAERYFSYMSFMSSDIFLKEGWDKGKTIYSEDIYGYEFLGPILYGIQGYKCLYVEYPMLIQTHPSGEVSRRTYAKKWPLYSLVAIPRMLKKLEEIGAVRDWRACFENWRHNCDEDFDYCLEIIAANQDFYYPYREELIDYQSDPQRKLILDKLLQTGQKATWARFWYKLKKDGWKYLLAKIKRII